MTPCPDLIFFPNRPRGEASTVTESRIDTNLLPGRGQLQAIARHLGDHVNAKALYAESGIRVDEFHATGDGQAIVFRFGAMVTFDVEPAAAERFRLAVLKHTANAQTRSETEEALITVVPGLDLSGRSAFGLSTERGLPIPRATAGCLYIVAQVLAKSTALAYYEGEVGQVFERIEPLARRIEHGNARTGARELLRHLGAATLTQMTTTGRMEVRDKPDLVWDHPELERLWGLLEDEYELVERDGILSRKLELISSTTTTFYQLLQANQTHRVEWYIVILILVEIVIIVYQMLLT